MAGDDSSDFTFCQVSPPMDQFHVESPKALQSIQKIKLDDTSNDAPNGSEGSSLIDTQNREIINAQQTENLQREVVKPSHGGGGTSESSDATTEKKPVQKKPVRAKVPFEKGYSQMDWLKLTQTDPDLAGLKGKSNRRLITLEEVKQHKNTEGHIWTVLKGRVYNISPYLKFHPGGVDMLMKAAGKDCTSLFIVFLNKIEDKYHAWVNAEFLIEKCLVGYLDVSE